MNFSIVHSHKGAKKHCPVQGHVVIENKSRFDNNILLSMVNHIVDTSMPFIKNSQDLKVRFVFTESSWGASGVVKHYYHRHYDSICYDDGFEVFVRIPTNKQYYYSVGSSYRIPKKENLDMYCKGVMVLASRIYRIAVHELKHLDDHVCNYNGGNQVFAKALHSRRTNHSKRPEEVRAKKAAAEFNLNNDIVQQLEWDMIDKVF